MTVQRLLLFLMISVSLLPAAPVLSPDSISLSQSDPGLGVRVIAFPGSVWEVWFNDNWKNDRPGHHGDFDFNDLVVGLTFGAAGTIQVLGSTSADLNVALAGGLVLLPWDRSLHSFIYDPGVELVVRMDDLSTGHHYFSGPADANPDGVVHAWTQMVENPPPGVPEPGSFVLGAIGVTLLGLRKLGRCRP